MKLLLPLLTVLLLTATLALADGSRWETGLVQAVAPCNLTGVAVSYRVLNVDQWGVWADGGLVRNGQSPEPQAQYQPFVGASTDMPVFLFLSEGLRKLAEVLKAPKPKYGMGLTRDDCFAYARISLEF